MNQPIMEPIICAYCDEPIEEDQQRACSEGICVHLDCSRPQDEIEIDTMGEPAPSLQDATNTINKKISDAMAVPSKMIGRRDA